MNTAIDLEPLLRRGDLWRGTPDRLADLDASPVVASGHDALDRELPGGGWPLGAVTELLLGHRGIGELELLMPALAELSGSGRELLWVNPPWLPYPPALAAAGIDLGRLTLVQGEKGADALWAMEQALRSGACGAVLGWWERIDNRALRRLQLAAEEGEAMAVLFRPLRDRARPSPAALRLHLSPSREGVRVEIIKRRGGWSHGEIHLSLGHAVA